MKFFKNKKGFTLVELVVVIAILGILAGIAIPRFMDATATARGSKIVADMRTIESAISMQYAKTGSYSDSVQGLVNGGYLASLPVAPTGEAKITRNDKTTLTYTPTSTAYGIKSVTTETTNADGMTSSSTTVIGTATLDTHTLNYFLTGNE